jgi:hypothetical protein
MKKLKTILTLIIFFVFSLSFYAQTGPPDPPDGHGDEGDQNSGGDAPVGAGIFLLLGLGAAYGARKVYVLKRAEEPE